MLGAAILGIALAFPALPQVSAAPNGRQDDVQAHADGECAHGSAPCCPDSEEEGPCLPGCDDCACCGGGLAVPAMFSLQLGSVMTGNRVRGDAPAEPPARRTDDVWRPPKRLG